MFYRRVAALTAVAAIALVACTPAASSPSASTGTAESPAASAPASAPASAAAGQCVVGVSWNNFQQPRWAAKDRPSMQHTITDGGGIMIDFDANLSNTQQLTDVQTLISQGAKVLVLLALDDTTGAQAVKLATDAGIPVIAYDRLIEDPGVLYMSFDNTDVGFAEADAMFKKVPKGNYVLIKGHPGDANAKTFLPAGWDKAGLKDKVASGDITIVGPADGTFTDQWDTTKATNNMEAIIDAANASNQKIDAVLAENDSTALGVVNALKAKSYAKIPVSGQDGDTANLQNVASGDQYVDVWKNSNELGKAAGAAALQLCDGKKFADLELPEGLVLAANAPVAGNKPAEFTTPKGNKLPSYILQVQPVTPDNLQLILDSKWLTKDVLCKNATDPSTAAAVCKGAGASPSP